MKNILTVLASVAAALAAGAAVEWTRAQGGAGFYTPSSGDVIFTTAPECGPGLIPYVNAHGRFVLGGTSGVNSHGGSNTIAATTLPAHAHPFSIGNHSHGFSVSGHTHSFSFGAHGHTFSVGTHTHSFSDSHSHTFSGTAHNHGASGGSHGHGAGLHIHGLSVPTRISATSSHQHSYSYYRPNPRIMLESALVTQVSITGASESGPDYQSDTSRGGGATAPATVAVTVNNATAGGSVSSGSVSGTTGSGGDASSSTGSAGSVNSSTASAGAVSGTATMAGAITTATGSAGTTQANRQHVPAHVVLRPCQVA